ncbi:lamin tail domain-containing protein [Rudaeicoccus suwonensis]|uniref:Lamin tail-like protein n=1 Tax=Rudaeicoccus suwonensis TaxID=657409 RepID=A0A561E9L4_9MICO|nr:lamin tail domain-containing protein [Rudaeicoccus suwonensis]TWE12270.1 lamin tail-like protein [Rudaeicoccus suwonensis]
MRRTTAALAHVLAVTVLAGGFAGIVGPTDAQAAAPPVKFGKWFVDLPGTDRATSSSLNKEYIVVTNTTRKAMSLKGYKVRDSKAKHTYTFGTFTLGAKKSVTIHTGSGRNSAANLYWSQRNFVWNNTGDTATLLNPKGKIVTSCTYVKPKKSTSKTGGFKTC